jgi:hypothetical protein
MNEILKQKNNSLQKRVGDESERRRRTIRNVICTVIPPEYRLHLRLCFVFLMEDESQCLTGYSLT